MQWIWYCAKGCKARELIVRYLIHITQQPSKGLDAFKTFQVRSQESRVARCSFRRQLQRQLIIIRALEAALESYIQQIQTSCRRRPFAQRMFSVQFLLRCRKMTLICAAIDWIQRSFNIWIAFTLPIMATLGVPLVSFIQPQTSLEDMAKLKKPALGTKTAKTRR